MEKSKIILLMLILALTCGIATTYDARTEILRQAQELQPFIEECTNVEAYKTAQGVAIQQICETETERTTTTAKKTIYIDFTTQTFVRTTGR